MKFLRAIVEPATRQGARAEGPRPPGRAPLARGRAGFRQPHPARDHQALAAANRTPCSMTSTSTWRPESWSGSAARNGAGKTTLLRIIAGVITPDAGTVRLQGLDPERDRRRYQSRIGFLSAGNTGLIARLSARYQLNYWAHWRSCRHRSARRRSNGRSPPSPSTSWRRSGSTGCRWDNASASASRWSSFTLPTWCCSTSPSPASTTRARRCCPAPSAR